MYNQMAKVTFFFEITSFFLIFLHLSSKFTQFPSRDAIYCVSPSPKKTKKRRNLLRLY